MASSLCYRSRILHVTGRDTGPLADVSAAEKHASVGSPAQQDSTPSAAAILEFIPVQEPARIPQAASPLLVLERASSPERARLKSREDAAGLAGRLRFRVSSDDFLE